MAAEMKGAAPVATLSVGPAYQSMDMPVKNEAAKNLCCPSCLSCCLGTFLPCTWCCACTVLNEKTELVMLNYGQYQGTLREPGCYCLNQCGLQGITVSTKRQVHDLANVKVADARGNPLLLSGAVAYVIINSRKAALGVSNSDSFVNTQGLVVLKRIAAMYPYESRDGSPSLKSEVDSLRQTMMQLLQERVEDAGVRILNFELTDLAYAPEIAKGMLVRQQADAKLDARKVIVEGAVEIAHGAVTTLVERGVRMGEADQAKLVSSLLITICSDAGIQPTLSVDP